MIGRAVFAMVAAIALAGCFASEEPLIEAGEAVLPIDHRITICLEDDQPCIELLVDGDGYQAAPGGLPDAAGRARFAPLVHAAGKQVFILEVQPEGSPGYIHLIARRTDNPDAKGSDLDLAAPDCRDLDGEVSDAFETSGGVISVGMVSTCFSPDLDALKTAWINTYGAELGDDDWWASRAD